MVEVSGLKRVVVTGMGITSCLGNDLDTVADNLKNAKYVNIYVIRICQSYFLYLRTA